MKITFEGKTMEDVFSQIQDALRIVYSAHQDEYRRQMKPVPAPPPEAVAKPEKLASPKPDAAERMAKARAAKGKKKAPEPVKVALKSDPVPESPPLDPRSSDEAWEEDKPAKFEDITIEQPEPEPDPTKLAALRVKTTEDLQAAYSGGKHKQVLALLSRYGNGAKSFRELRIEDFIPIRKAIDEGALA